MTINTGTTERKATMKAMSELVVAAYIHVKDRGWADANGDVLAPECTHALNLINNCGNAIEDAIHTIRLPWPKALDEIQEQLRYAHGQMEENSRQHALLKAAEGLVEILRSY